MGEELLCDINKALGAVKRKLVGLGKYINIALITRGKHGRNDKKSKGKHFVHGDKKSYCLEKEEVEAF